MLDLLQPLPVDPILGLSAACRADPNPAKVDLTVGVYMDASGVCPVFEAVRRAQRELQEHEVTKAYMAAAGDELFNTGMQRLVLGAGSAVLADSRVSSIQTPGGCGALRIGAEVIHNAAPGARVWISDPSWPVHIPLVGSVGLRFETYRYYNPASHGVDFDGMVADLAGAVAGDVVLLHACCHNPSGADLDAQQWEEIARMAERQGFLPFIDVAYQGLAVDLDTDVAGLRLLAERLPEVVIAASCSKNMGLYRERTGATLFVCRDRAGAERALDHGRTAARRVYSMPPAHGALLAGRVLADDGLAALWRQELAVACRRINGLRSQLRAALESRTGADFGFIEREKGMFSFLGLSREQVLRLRQAYGVYMLDSSRISVAGINDNNIDYVVDAVASVL